jgi:hypothetical protein
VTTEIQIKSVVRSDSAETLRKATEVASEFTRPDEKITRTIKTFPGGVEQVEKRAFRLGDYFDSVELVASEPDDPKTFSIIFHIRRGVDSTWKPLVLAVLRAISDGVPGVIASLSPPNAPR